MSERQAIEDTNRLTSSVKLTKQERILKVSCKIGGVDKIAAGSVHGFFGDQLYCTWNNKPVKIWAYSVVWVQEKIVKNPCTIFSW